MHIASKAIRVLGLLILLLLGMAAILAAHLGYIAQKVPLGIHGDGRVYTGGWDRGFIAANGTWTIESQGHAFPLNTSEIRCVKSDGLCYAAEARVSDGYLTAGLELYDIKKWDSTTLEFVTEAACVTYAYVINRSTEKLTGRRLKTATTDPTCQLIVLEPDLKLSFVNGLDVVRNLHDQHAPTGFSIAAATAWVLFILVWIVRVVRR
jgi:hypothetical protein